MEIVPSTFIVIAAVGLLLTLGLQRGFWIFFALCPLGAAAAFNMPAVGGASFGLKEFLVFVVFAMVCGLKRGPDHIVGTTRPWQPGFLLMLLAIYCTVSAMFAPRVFAGVTDVFSIARSANKEGIISTPLGPSNGNITQLFSFTISVLAFIAFATVARLHPDKRSISKAMIIVTMVHVGLGLIDVVSAAVGAPQVLDVIRTANYSILADHKMMGVKRMIGGMPEASSFGVLSIGLFGYWLHLYLNGKPSRLTFAMLALSLFAVLRSTSSGAYVALVLFALIYGVVFAATKMRGQVTRRMVITAFSGLMVVWGVTLVMFAAYEFVDPVTAYLDETVFNKLESQSGVERMSWNTQAFTNFVDTGLIGAGLGSVRASNWLLACLGSIGLVGTGLFIAFLISVFRMRAEGRDAQTVTMVGALKTGCFGLMLSDLLIAATPNFGVFFFALAGLATGLARSTVSSAQSRQPIMRMA